jgi:hypothetical protein
MNCALDIPPEPRPNFAELSARLERARRELASALAAELAAKVRLRQAERAVRQAEVDLQFRPFGA